MAPDAKGAFWCRFGLRNMGVTQAGSSAPNSSHHHLLIDVNSPIVQTSQSPKTRHIFTSAPGRLRARIDLPPGKHTLQLVLGDPAPAFNRQLCPRRSPLR